MTNQKFGINLKNLRLGGNKLGKKYSQKDISVVTGISRSLISEYENQIKEPTLSVIIKLAEFFDVSLDELCL